MAGLKISWPPTGHENTDWPFSMVLCIFTVKLTIPTNLPSMDRDQTGYQNTALSSKKKQKKGTPKT